MESNFDILKNICQNRKSTRKFSGESVANEDIEKIIEIAKTAPYVSGQGKWDILVIKETDILHQMANLVQQCSDDLSKIVREDFKDFFISYSKNFTFFENANTVLVLTYRISPVLKSLIGSDTSVEILQYERDNFSKSISCVAMLVLLACESLNLGACYMTGPILAKKQLQELLKTKHGHEIGAIIPIGHKI